VVWNGWGGEQKKMNARPRESRYPIQRENTEDEKAIQRKKDFTRTTWGEGGFQPHIARKKIVDPKTTTVFCSPSKRRPPGAEGGGFWKYKEGTGKKRTVSWKAGHAGH